MEPTLRGKPGISRRRTRRIGNPGQYITIDRWSSKDEFDEFMVHKLRDYERLDRVHEAITVSEELLGKGSA